MRGLPDHGDAWSRPWHETGVDCPDSTLASPSPTPPARATSSWRVISPATSMGWTNDAVADPAGRFWVTTMAYTTPSPAPAPCTAWDVLKGLTIPNGPAFSPDGTLLYFADSGRGVVHRFEVDRDGDPAARRVFLHTPHHTPDGMTTDVAGNLWIAFWGASVVRRYRPDGRLGRSNHAPRPPADEFVPAVS